VVLFHLFFVCFPTWPLPFFSPHLSTTPPTTAIDAVQAGLKDGLEQLEIEFPISPGRIDVSLGEFLDDTREWTREFVRPFTPKGSKLWVIFPDGKEATLANERWGGVNFRIMGIETAMKMPKEEVCELQVCVWVGGEGWNGWWRVAGGRFYIKSCLPSHFSLPPSFLPSSFHSHRWLSLRASTCKNTSTSKKFDGLVCPWWS